jgi:hypothetical protein
MDHVSSPDIARVFINEIVRLHGVPKNIISYKGSVFTGRFWTSFEYAWGRNLISLWHIILRLGRKIERTNQILEYMLRMYIMDQHKHWEEFIPLVKFTYNNNYQSSIKMEPFEFLYGRLCRTPIS